MATRYPLRFESLDGTISVEFSDSNLEWESGQPYRIPSAPAIGADYLHDFLGVYTSPKDNGTEAVNFYLVAVRNDIHLDELLDELISKVDRIGRGRLWTLGANGSLRWCEARATGKPEPSIRAEYANFIPVSMEFSRYTDWYAETENSLTEVVTSVPHIFNVNHLGNIRTEKLVIRVRSDAVNGAHNMSLVNSATAQQIVTTRDLVTAADEWKVDSGEKSVQYSDDDGASYEDDYDKVTLPDGQHGFIDLEPGVNSLTYDSAGSPTDAESVTLELTWWDTFR